MANSFESLEGEVTSCLNIRNLTHNLNNYFIKHITKTNCNKAVLFTDKVFFGYENIIAGPIMIGKNEYLSDSIKCPDNLGNAPFGYLECIAC